MYYCELPEEKNIIRTHSGVRVVGKFVAAANFIPSGLRYQCTTIVKSDEHGQIWWVKNRYTCAPPMPLTDKEKDQLLLQILKSEIW